MASVPSQTAQPDADHSGLFTDILDKGEKLLWEGRPGASAYAAAHVRAVFMGLALLAFALIWHQMASNAASLPQLKYATWLIVTFGGAYALVPLWSYVVGKHYLFYALTNKRLVIMKTFPRHTVTAFAIKDIDHVVHTGGRAGKGGSVLIDAPGAQSKGIARARAGFYGIKYSAKLEEAVKTLKNPEAVLKQAQANAKTQVQAMSLKAPTAGAGPAQEQRRAFMPSSHVVH